MLPIRKIFAMILYEKGQLASYLGKLEKDEGNLMLAYAKALVFLC